MRTKYNVHYIFPKGPAAVRMTQRLFPMHSAFPSVRCFSLSFGGPDLPAPPWGGRRRRRPRQGKAPPPAGPNCSGRTPARLPFGEGHIPGKWVGVLAGTVPPGRVGFWQCQQRLRGPVNGCFQEKFAWVGWVQFGRTQKWPSWGEGGGCWRLAPHGTQQPMARSTLSARPRGGSKDA